MSKRQLPDQPPPYPWWINTGQERRRWRLSLGIAERVFGDTGEASTLMAARAIYDSAIPTDDPEADEAEEGR